jgi:hypothetical protein
VITFSKNDQVDVTLEDGSVRSATVHEVDLGSGRARCVLDPIDKTRRAGGGSKAAWFDFANLKKRQKQ